MRRLVLQMQMSADGFVGSLDGSPWQLWDWGENNGWDDELKAGFNAHFERLDTILLSRKMLEEGYLTHWGNAASRYPAEPFFAFAKRITDADKVVPTDKLKQTGWPRTTLVSGDLEREVRALKSRSGKDIGVFGGAGFASALIAADLVDEVQLYINPAALGDGVGLFEVAGFRRLQLKGARAFSCGMVVSCYALAS